MEHATIRPAVPDDAEEITRLSVVHHGHELTPEVAEIMGGDFRGRLAEKDMLAFVIDAEGGGLAAVAWGTVKRAVRTVQDPEGLVAWLNVVTTIPRYRRRGYGEALMRAFVEELRMRGCWSVACFVGPEARGLCDRLGFTVPEKPCMVLRLEPGGRLPEQQAQVWRPQLHHFG